jgi:hypothetical protein
LLAKPTERGLSRAILGGFGISSNSFLHHAQSVRLDMERQSDISRGVKTIGLRSSGETEGRRAGMKELSGRSGMMAWLI